MTPRRNCTGVEKEVPVSSDISARISLLSGPEVGKPNISREGNVLCPSGIKQQLLANSWVTQTKIYDGVGDGSAGRNHGWRVAVDAHLPEHGLRLLQVKASGCNKSMVRVGYQTACLKDPFPGWGQVPLWVPPANCQLWLRAFTEGL